MTTRPSVELAVRHTRHSSPVRRVTVERFDFPESAAPHAPALLLAAVVVRHMPRKDELVTKGWTDLLDGIEAGRPMPRRTLRHRLQIDPIGLDRSVHRITSAGEDLRLDVDSHGPGLPQVIAVAACLAGLTGTRRRSAFELVRAATEMAWTTAPAVLRGLVDHLDAPVVALDTGDEVLVAAEVGALAALGFEHVDRPSRTEVLAAFRRHVRAAHPDHGADSSGAGERVAALDAARQLLLGTITSQ